MGRRKNQGGLGNKSRVGKKIMRTGNRRRPHLKGRKCGSFMDAGKKGRRRVSRVGQGEYSNDRGICGQRKSQTRNPCRSTENQLEETEIE